MTDEDFSFWFSIRNDEINYGEGKGSDVSVTFKATREILMRNLFGDLEQVSAHEAGDLVIEGSMEDAKVFDQIPFIISQVTSQCAVINFISEISTNPETSEFVDAAFGEMANNFEEKWDQYMMEKKKKEETQPDE